MVYVNHPEYIKFIDHLKTSGLLKENILPVLLKSAEQKSYHLPNMNGRMKSICFKRGHLN